MELFEKCGTFELQQRQTDTWYSSSQHSATVLCFEMFTSGNKEVLRILSPAIFRSSL
jgi:hypothetical protein